MKLAPSIFLFTYLFGDTIYLAYDTWNINEEVNPYTPSAWDLMYYLWFYISIFVAGVSIQSLLKPDLLKGYFVYFIGCSFIRLIWIGFEFYDYRAANKPIIVFILFLINIFTIACIAFIPIPVKKWKQRSG